MREIKFRGKSSENGEWLYGDLFTDSFNDEVYIHQTTGNGQTVKADSATVGQFTGLKDKDGKDIYEGDIVYLAGQGNIEMEFPFIDLYEAAMENDIGAIIGNIHDNPEMLK